MSEPMYEVVWPLGKSVYRIASLAPHIADLGGKTVCELWDEGFRGDEVFAVIRESLSKQYPGVKLGLRRVAMVK